MQKSAAHRRPPGPPQSWFGGSFREFRRDFLGFAENCARTYGDIAWFRLGKHECLMVSHPELVETVLVKNAKNVVKHFALRYARGVLGNGLLTSEGTFWLRQRRLAAPAFHADRIAAYGPEMVQATERLLAEWQDGQTRDVHADMMRLTLDIAARTLFGADVSEDSREVDEALHAALTAFYKRVRARIPLPFWVPTPNNLRAKATTARLNRVVQHLIEQRRNSPPGRDFISLLLHARDEDDGTGMSDEQLADEARTFLLAGHETTALSLSWAMYLLATNPAQQQTLQRELDRELGGRAPTVADVPRLKFAEHVILETMRLYPPAYVIGRETLVDLELGGYHVPAGTTIFMSQWVIHRDPRFYDRPTAFEPERWSSPEIEHQPKLAYFPFGAGPRICIGNTFAMQESVLVLAKIAQSWGLTVEPKHPIELAPLITLRPRHGIRLIVSKRTEIDR